MGLVAGTYFVVTLFNAAVTNNAAVSIFFPIAWEVASQSKMDFYPILLTLMFAGSADFSTPYGSAHPPRASFRPTHPRVHAQTHAA